MKGSVKQVMSETILLNFDLSKPGTMKRFTILTLLLSTFFISCRFTTGKRINGNGNITTESRQVGSFSGVNVSSDIDVYIKQDSIASVKIETDENLLEFVHITIDDGILEIEEEDGFNLRSAKGIKVYVSGPSFKSFEVSGASNIYGENKITGNNEIDIQISGAGSLKMELNAPAIRAELSGASHLGLKGETKNLRLDGSGASSIDCFDLMSEETQVDLSGASNADVYASVKLVANVSGASDVKYIGNAAVTQDVSGAGSVKKVK